jgi:murein DD-endopeptidase MepM/ murein hydrolase activator NlpD
VTSKKLTIFVVPDGTSRVRQFKIPRFLPLIFCILFLSISVMALWSIRDYQVIKTRMPQLSRLQMENELQKTQLQHLARRIDETLTRMCELKEFDRKLKIMVNLENGDEAQEFQGIGGSEPGAKRPLLTMAGNRAEFFRSMHRSLDALDSEITTSEQDKAELYKFLENQKVILASTPSIWPTKGWLSSRFGYRMSPFTGKKEFHKGIDISTRIGAPIVAPADGIVSKVYQDRGYGNVLCIHHGYGVSTKYAHLKNALVKKGQFVSRGETIALVGKTGRTTGPHLHYEVHLNKVAVDPLRYIFN